MSTLIETMECFPRPLNFLGAREFPAPPVNHQACAGGYHQPGLIGGWACPCWCHRLRCPTCDSQDDEQKYCSDEWHTVSRKQRE